MSVSVSTSYVACEVADRRVDVDRLDRVAGDEVDRVEHLREPQQVLVVGPVADPAAAVEVEHVRGAGDRAERDGGCRRCAGGAPGLRAWSVNDDGAVVISDDDHPRVEAHPLALGSTSAPGVAQQLARLARRGCPCRSPRGSAATRRGSTRARRRRRPLSVGSAGAVAPTVAAGGSWRSSRSVSGRPRRRLVPAVAGASLSPTRSPVRPGSGTAVRSARTRATVPGNDDPLVARTALAVTEDRDAATSRDRAYGPGGVEVLEPGGDGAQLGETGLSPAPSSGSWSSSSEHVVGASSWVRRGGRGRRRAVLSSWGSSWSGRCGAVSSWVRQWWWSSWGGGVVGVVSTVVSGGGASEGRWWRRRRDPRRVEDGRAGSGPGAGTRRAPCRGRSARRRRRASRSPATAAGGRGRCSSPDRPRGAIRPRRSHGRPRTPRIEGDVDAQLLAPVAVDLRRRRPTGRPM